MADIATEVKTAWPYFIPAWLHAMLLPIIISTLCTLLRNSENYFALFYNLSFLVWLFVLIPIRKRAVSITHAFVLVLLPYLPYVLFSIVSMPT